MFRLLLLNICLLSCTAFSQADSVPDKTELFDFYFAPGSSTFPVFAMSQENFKKIVPQSRILAGDIMKVNFNDFDNDTMGGYYNGTGRNAFYLQGGITIKLRNKEFKNAGPWIKLGVNYFSSSTLINTGIFKNSRQAADSVYFTSGLPVSRSVSNAQSVSYRYSCQSVNLEGTLVYRLNPEGIFSLFGGPGALFGLNFDGRAMIEETLEKSSKDYINIAGTGKVLFKDIYEKVVLKENFSLTPNLCFGIFINIGIDLKLGTHYDYIKNTHLFAEVKPMFRSYAVKGAGFQSSVILVGNVGLRYQLL